MHICQSWCFPKLVGFSDPKISQGVSPYGWIPLILGKRGSFTSCRIVLPCSVASAPAFFVTFPASDEAGKSNGEMKFALTLQPETIRQDLIWVEKLVNCPGQRQSSNLYLPFLRGQGPAFSSLWLAIIKYICLL